MGQNLSISKKGKTMIEKVGRRDFLIMAGSFAVGATAERFVEPLERVFPPGSYLALQTEQAEATFRWLKRCGDLWNYKLESTQAWGPNSVLIAVVERPGLFLTHQSMEVVIPARPRVEKIIFGRLRDENFLRVFQAQFSVPNLNLRGESIEGLAIPTGNLFVPAPQWVPVEEITNHREPKGEIIGQKRNAQVIFKGIPISYPLAENTELFLGEDDVWRNIHVQVRLNLGSLFPNLENIEYFDTVEPESIRDEQGNFAMLDPLPKGLIFFGQEEVRGLPGVTKEELDEVGGLDQLAQVISVKSGPFPKRNVEHYFI